jgi:hypothetical protein
VQRHIRSIHLSLPGFDPAIQHLLDDRLKAGHELVNPLSAPRH